LRDSGNLQILVAPRTRLATSTWLLRDWKHVEVFASTPDDTLNSAEGFSGTRPLLRVVLFFLLIPRSNSMQATSNAPSPPQETDSN
jgi:hypothetical protein